MYTAKYLEKIIEDKRNKLNINHRNTQEALKASQDLDEWIVEYYKLDKK